LISTHAQVVSDIEERRAGNIVTPLKRPCSQHDGDRLRAEQLAVGQVDCVTPSAKLRTSRGRSMAEAAQRRDKLNVFVSYSRDDLAFADQLRVALQGFGFGVAIDRDDITGGDAWKSRLSDLIRDADTVVFVLSPSSADSPTCAWEVKQAVAGGKRILPVLCRALDSANPPSELATLNYLYFYPEPRFPGSGFGKGLVELASALNTDSDWLREHTRYLRLAKEWEEVGKPSDRRLLSAADIALAKAWADNRPPKASEITPLQLDFIEASGAEDFRRQSAEAERLQKVADAERSAKEAAEARAAAEASLRATAEQAHRTSEAAARRFRNALVAVAVAAVLALVAFFVSLHEFRRASDQLDRANHAIAESINNDLDLKPGEPLTPRQRQALWKLAFSDEPVKRHFFSILADSPEETVRVSPGFAQISRALGLLMPSKAEMESLVEPLVNQIALTTDPKALAALVEALQALAPKLTEAQASQALEPVLKQIGQATDSDALQALAEALQALAPKLTEAQSSQVLDLALNQINQTTDSTARRNLVKTLQALAPKLTEAQASHALEPVLNQIGQTTDFFNFRALVEALQALAPKLTEAQVSQVLDLALKQMGQTTDPATLRIAAVKLEALAPQLTDAPASRAFDITLERNGQTTDPDALLAMAEALNALAARLTEAQASQALDTVLKQMGQTTDPKALLALAAAVHGLPIKLTEAQASQALDTVLKQMGQTTDLALVNALRALAAKLTGAPISQALDTVLKQIAQPTDFATLSELGRALEELAANLTDAQANQALDLLLRLIGQPPNPARPSELARPLPALAAKLNEAQASHALGLVLTQIGQTTDPDVIRARARTFQALAEKLTEAEAASKTAAASLAWAADGEEAAEWARALVALSRPLANREVLLVNAIAYPAAGGPATEVLLDAIRGGHPDAPAKEKGTEAALEWVAKTFPEVLRPPRCPEPLQSDLKCPPSASQ
jgi:TIR domain